MESLKGSMSDLMAHFHKRMSKFEARLPKSPNTAVSGPADVAAEYMEFKTFILQSLSCLQSQIELLASNHDALEMRGRRKMLLIHGVAEVSKEETAQVVAEVVCGKLKLEAFSAADIRRCHRMGNQANTGKPRPILVKLLDVDVRDNIWHAKTKLKGSGITLSEFLTRSRHQVFMAARERFGITNCWTKQGQIYILGPDKSRHRVVTLRELDSVGEPKLNANKPETAIVSRPPDVASRRKRAAVIAPKK
ncbi:hypothetical protein PYW07_007563 [Mythimna separata]|uniref:Uncharacterized protein n=1 Tax=Mythimna separata TaxID=271217 RepID=A0AAD8E180_MYTSE|nr:hypothetical protein PYW07_007563 [Mythimna separata]